MLDDVLAIPDHLRDALWRVQSARLEPWDSTGVLVCGVGGSAIGGDLAAAAIGERLERPLVTVRGYGLPGWVSPDWTVLCSSYSGGTEETRAGFAAAGEIGARRVVASTGGALVEAARDAGVPVIGLPGLLPAPRTGVAYMLVCAIEVAALAGASPRLGDEVEAAADFLAGEAERLRELAAEVAARIEGTIPVVHGAGLTVPAARRWKTQVNENAKLPAFFSELPEADHNELSGWGQGGHQLSAVALEDSGQHPRVRRAFELTMDAIGEAGAETVRLETAGETRVERLMWAVMLGDLVSLELAERRGVDPLPITAIDELKGELGAL